MMATSTIEHGGIGELVRYFLRLGCLGFGGPVALVGQMERELVDGKKWLTKEQMREAIAICQSLPGPLAIQVGIYISYLRGGFWGAWAGGWAFILPNFIIVAALGALYVYLGDLKPVTAIFYGVSPAVIALILHSCYRLAKLGMEDWLQWAIAAVCLAITVILQAEVALLFIGAGAAGILYYGSLFKKAPATLSGVVVVPAAAGAIAPVASGTTLSKLLLFFLKAGSLTFGSGLVIVPFLEQGLVQQHNWLDERQFLIAVAIGMISPGPVVITATFVGYLVAGFWGSLVSTIGIFLPSFLLDIDCSPAPGAASRQCQCPGIREGRLRGCDRHHSRRLYPARQDRNRRLAYRVGRDCLACGAIPLEIEQSDADRSHRSRRTDRVPAVAAGMGDGEMTVLVRGRGISNECEE
jgi:chromate transporter